MRAPPGVDQHARQDRGHHHLHHRRGGGADVGAADDVALAPVDRGGDAGLLVVLAVVDLDHLDPVDPLHDRGREAGGLLHRADGGGLRPAGEPLHKNAEQGADEKDSQRQPGVLDQHDHDQAHDHHRVLEVGEQRVGGRVPQQAGVVEHGRDERARVLGAKPREVGMDDAPEQVDLDAADDAVPDRVHRPALHDLRAGANEGQRDQHQGDRHHRAVAAQHVVGRRLHHVGDHRGRSGDRQRRGDRDGDLSGERAQVVARHAHRDAGQARARGLRLGVRHDPADVGRPRCGADCIFKTSRPASIWGQLTRIRSPRSLF